MILRILYIIGCVVLPIAWGLLIYRLSHFIDRLLLRFGSTAPGVASDVAAARGELRHIEYQI